MTLYRFSHLLCLVALLTLGLPLFALGQNRVDEGSNEEFANEPIEEVKLELVERFRLGLFVNYIGRFETVNFAELPQVPSCCPEYHSGGGSGFLPGIMAQIPLSEKTALQVRLGLQFMSADLTADERTRILVNNAPTDAIIEHSISSQFAALSIEPLFTYYASPQLSFAAGFGASFFLSNSFEQKEVLREPLNAGTFENGSRTRNVQSGAIEGLNSHYSFLLGGRFELPITKEKDLLLGAEAYYSFGLNSLINDRQWLSNQLRIGISAMYIIPYLQEFGSPIRPGTSLPRRD